MTNTAQVVSPEQTRIISSHGLLHVVTPGEHSISVEAPDGQDTTLIHVIDDRAMSLMMNRLSEDQRNPAFGGILIDFDGDSMDASKSSAAAGWVRELVRKPDGLYAKPELSDAGAAALAGKRYKYALAIFDPKDLERLDGGHVRPLRIGRVALTNRPYMKGLKPYVGDSKNTAFLNRVPRRDPDLTGASLRAAGIEDESGEAEKIRAGKIRNRANELRKIDPKIGRQEAFRLAMTETGSILRLPESIDPGK